MYPGPPHPAENADEFETQPGQLQWVPNWIQVLRKRYLMMSLALLSLPAQLVQIMITCVGLAPLTNTRCTNQ
jgi:hypothetical protein